MIHLSNIATSMSLEQVVPKSRALLAMADFELEIEFEFVPAVAVAVAERDTAAITDPKEDAMLSLPPKSMCSTEAEVEAVGRSSAPPRISLKITGVSGAS